MHLVHVNKAQRILPAASPQSRRRARGPVFDLQRQPSNLAQGSTNVASGLPVLTHATA